jgi:hypothetical protein
VHWRIATILPAQRHNRTVSMVYGGQNHPDLCCRMLIRYMVRASCRAARSRPTDAPLWKMFAGTLDWIFVPERAF